MKKFLVGLMLAVLSLSGQAQMMHGNTFPFWNVTGDLDVGGNATIGGTVAVTGATTFTAKPIVSTLTASVAVFSDASKGLVSNAITGTGNVVMSASPTLTGTISAASATLTGTTSTEVLVVSTSASPASNAACTAGTIVWDASYMYVCTATGVWKRAAITGGY